jgi:membrane protein YdbS with pleckstrin-like domain
VAYPEKLLADDEKVVAHLHPHWITLVPATLWFIVICAAAGAGIAFAPDKGTGRTVILILVVGVGLLLLGVQTLRPWVQWRSTHYVLTTHRILIRRGVFKHVGRDIALQRITDVGFVQTLLERIVGAGSLSIESASEHGQETLSNVPKSPQQQQLINRLIEQDGERRARLAYGGQPGYPPPGYPQQGQPGSLQQGAPQQGPPPQNYPQQGYPTEGFTQSQPPYPPQ